MYTLSQLMYLLQGTDVYMDIVGVLVLLFVGLFSWKCYKIDRKEKNKKYFYLALGFWVLAVGFLFKILTNFTIYYTTLKTQQVGMMMVTYTFVNESNVLFTIGMLVYRILTLLGLYFLFSLYYPAKDKATVFLMVFFILVTGYFLRSAFHIFHLTTFLFFLFITYYYYQNYCKTRDCLGKYLFGSFIVLTLSQFILMLYEVHPLFYSLGEVVQLIGYLGLAVTFFMVRGYGKKTIKN